MYGQFPPQWGYPPAPGQPVVFIPPAGSDPEKMLKLIEKVLRHEEKKAEKRKQEDKNKEKKDDKPKPRVFSFGEMLSAVILLGPFIGAGWFLVVKALLQHIN